VTILYGYGFKVDRRGALKIDGHFNVSFLDQLEHPLEYMLYFVIETIKHYGIEPTGELTFDVDEPLPDDPSDSTEVHWKFQAG